MNRKGFTVLELLVSIIILSVVLTFAMNLFLRVRASYTTEKKNIEMEVSKSIVIDTVMSDVYEYGVSSVNCVGDNVTINFNTTPVTKKILAFNKSDASYDYITYRDNANVIMSRRLPKGSLKSGPICRSSLGLSEGAITNIFYRIEDDNKNDYSIDMFLPA